MLQHIFHDGVGALTMLHNLFEVGLQHLCDLVQFFPFILIEVDIPKCVLHFSDQFS